MRIIPCVSVRWSGELSKFFAIVLFQIMTLSFPWKNHKFHAVPQSSSLQTSRNASEIMKFHENQRPCPPRQESAEGFSALKQIREAFVLLTVTNVNMNNSNLLLYFPKLQFLCMFHATIKYQDIWELLHFSSLNLWERVWVASFSVRIGLNALKSHIKENHVQNWQKIAMGHNKAWEEELLNKTKRLINAHKRNLTIKWGYDSFHIIKTLRPGNLIRRFLNKIWR